MGNVTLGLYTALQETTNTFYASNDNKCISWAKASVNNTTVIINDSDVGDITVAATGQADLTCLLNMSINTSIASQLLSSSDQQTYVGSLFNNFVLYNGDFKATTVTQAITNSITTITSAACGSSSQSIVNNTNIVVNEATSGNIYVEADGVSSSSCTMTNLITQQAFNTNQAFGTMDTVNESAFTGIIIAIVAIVIVVVVAVIVVAISKGLISSRKKSPDEVVSDELKGLASEATATAA